MQDILQEPVKACSNQEAAAVYEEKTMAMPFLELVIWKLLAFSVILVLLGTTATGALVSRRR